MNNNNLKALGCLILIILFGAGWTTQAQQARDTYRQVKPSVVEVRTLRKAVAPFPQDGPPLEVGIGSGVLISNDGQVMTAAHVVQSADLILVVFPDGNPIQAHVTHSAVYADVALLQIDRVPAGAVAAKLGDSDQVDVGDEILVVGSPYGLSPTLSIGHISGRYRPGNKVVGASAIEFLQTDAVINTGNSGGPMFNLSGEVVGIVSQILTRSGGFEGIGFAATSKMARQLLLDQKMFWSGVEGMVIEGDLARALNLPQAAGFLVQRVAQGSPAWRGGIRAGALRAQIEGEELLLGGDIILEVNGIAVEKGDRSFDQIDAATSRLKAGEKLTSKVLREGQVIELCATINQ